MHCLQSRTSQRPCSCCTVGTPQLQQLTRHDTQLSKPRELFSFLRNNARKHPSVLLFLTRTQSDAVSSSREIDDKCCETAQPLGTEPMSALGWDSSSPSPQGSAGAEHACTGTDREKLWRCYRWIPSSLLSGLSSLLPSSQESDYIYFWVAF